MKEEADELRENFTWWHRRWARKRQSAARSDASRHGDAPQWCHKRRAASQEYDEHVCKSMAKCSSGEPQTVVAEVVPRSRPPRSVGSSPLFIRRPLRVLGCASTPSTLDSDYRLAEAHTEDETPIRPAKKQRLWRNIKLTTSSIRMGAKSEAANETLSSLAPELARNSKQTAKQDQQKQTSVEEKVAPKIDEYVTFLVKIRLKDGKNLVVSDASGSSDPYVKFKYKNRTYFKSNTIYKNLNPVWEEEFSQLIDDPTTPIAVDVYDYDRFAADDYMGGGLVDLSQLRLFQPTDLKVKLKEEGTDEMGEINLVVTVTPLTQTEKEQFMKKCVKGITSEQLKRPQKATQIWQSVVNVVLVEGRNLYSPTNSTSLPDPFVKFKLGSEKYKSKPASRTRNPKWLEQFDLHMYDAPSHILEVMVNDKRTNSCMGTTSVDLNKLDKESANQLLRELENGSGSILLLISISGTISTDAVVDLCEFTSNDIRNAIISKYNILRTFQRLSDVGYLTVKVFQARNLIAADMGGKSDPFAVVELVNARLQTHTEYRTLNPVWNKLFTFSVKDIHAVLEITIYDEDPNKKAEFLGKVAIPLLKIKNCEKRWYALKDRKLDQPARGQVQVELDVIWNPIRAAVRTFNPREDKYMHAEPKFKRQVFMHNYSRLKNSLLYAIEAHDYVQSCFNWNSPRRSITAFMIYLLWVYFFELYHIPLCILALFLRAHLVKYYNTNGVDITQGETSPHGVDEDDDISQHDSGANKQLKRQTTERQQSKDSERSSTTLKDRLSAIQDTLAMVQNTMDFIACLLERIKNTFNFTQPYLSILAIVVLTIATILLYIIPLRWILIAWGINKFTKKLRNPNFIPNNELLDFLSRVPSDAEIKAYEEVKIDERLLAHSSVESSTTQRAAS